MTPTQSATVPITLQFPTEHGQVCIQFCSHWLPCEHTDANGITLLLEKVKSIQNFPMSMSIKQLHSFIEMINLYRWFIPNCSSILNPLRNLLHSRNKGISLESDLLHAFHTAKTALANFTKLSFMENDSKTRICLTMAVSDSGVVAVVQQELHSHCVLFCYTLSSPVTIQYLL